MYARSVYNNTLSPSVSFTVCITEDLCGCETGPCMQGVCTINGVSPYALWALWAVVRCMEYFSIKHSLFVLQRNSVAVEPGHSCRGGVYQGHSSCFAISFFNNTYNHSVCSSFSKKPPSACTHLTILSNQLSMTPDHVDLGMC